VKVALPRPLMFNNTTHRPATIQRIRLGADRDGKITAIGHESWSGDLPGGGPETAVQQTRLLYAGANRMTKMRWPPWIFRRATPCARPARRRG
jgi:xanthine dehydrogenase YagR molybdenum-binding subunit